jgi:site-specific DNA-methyltransferase (adenine-specific)
MRRIEDMLGKIINADCVDVMANLPDKCVDLTLTDFPYARDVPYDGYADTEESLKNLITRAMPQILRISKRALITVGTHNIHLYPRPKWILNWTVPAGAAYVEWGFSCWQPVLAYGNDPYLEKRLGARPDTLVLADTAKKNGHPCPKPENVWRWFLLRGSVDPNDIVFDPFMGSGTTAVVAKETGRRWAGVELSARYCTIAEKRLNSTTMMMREIVASVVQQTQPAMI